MGVLLEQLRAGRPRAPEGDEFPRQETSPPVSNAPGVLLERLRLTREVAQPPRSLTQRLVSEAGEPLLERAKQFGIGVTQPITDFLPPVLIGHTIQALRARRALAHGDQAPAIKMIEAQRQEREARERFPAARFGGEIVGNLLPFEAGIQSTRLATPVLQRAITHLPLVTRLAARGVELAPIASVIGVVHRAQEGVRTGQPTTPADLARTAAVSGALAIPIGAAAEAIGTLGQVMNRNTYQRVANELQQEFLKQNPTASQEVVDQFRAALARDFAEKGVHPGQGPGLLKMLRAVRRIREGRLDLKIPEGPQPAQPSPPTPSTPRAPGRLPAPARPVLSDLRATRPVISPQPLRAPPEALIAPPAQPPPQLVAVGQPSRPTLDTMHARMDEIERQLPQLVSQGGQGEAIRALKREHASLEEEAQNILYPIPTPHVKIVKSLVELLPEDVEAVKSAVTEIEAGQAGRRTRTDVGDWIGIPSSFPEYFKNKGYTKKESLSILNKVLEHQPVTDKQKAIAIDLMAGSRAHVQAEKEAFDAALTSESEQARSEGHSPESIAAHQRAGEAEAEDRVTVEGLGEQAVEGQPLPPGATEFEPATLEANAPAVPAGAVPVQQQLPGTEPAIPSTTSQPTPLVQEEAGPLVEQPSPETPSSSVAQKAVPVPAEIPPEERATPYQVDPSAEATSVKAPSAGLSISPLTTSRINKTQILQYIWDAFKIPTRGFATHPAEARAGFHAPHEILSRINVWGDLETIMHETAHGIDAHVEKIVSGRRLIKGRGQTQWYRALGKTTAERTQIINELADLDYDAAKRRTHEGFAEYLRHWLTDDGQAITLAPMFHHRLHAWLASQHPDLHNNLTGLQRRYQLWRDQGALARMAAQVDWKGEHTTISAKHQVFKVLQQVENRFLDELQPILRMMEAVGASSGTMEPKDDPFKWATYSKQKSSGIARTFIETAAVDEFGNVIGPSLIDVLKPVVHITNLTDLLNPSQAKTLKHFFTYALALRSQHLATRGIESGFELGDVHAVIQQFDTPVWRQVAQDLTTWSEHPIKWVERAGGLHPGTADVFRALNPVYVMMKRAFLDDPSARMGTGRLFSSGKPVHEIRGSGRAVIHPLFSMVEQMAQLIARAHKMRVAGLIADLATREGSGAWVNAVPLARKATTFKLDQIYTQLRKAGYHLMVEAGGTLIPAKNPLGGETLDELLTVLTHTPYYTGKETIVPVFRNGKLKLYELHPDVFQSLQGLDAIQLNALTRFTSPFTRMKRLGATGVNPAFGLLRNPFKDALTFSLFSHQPWATPFDPLIRAAIRRVKGQTGPGTFPFRFRAAGGDISSQLGYDRAQTMGVLDDALLQHLGPMGKTLMVVKHPFDALRRILNIPELWPRIAEGEAMMARLAKDHPDWAPESVFIEAFNAGQDVTTNFSKSGSWGKQVNQVDFTFNASIQGLNKLYREATSHPWRTGARGFAWLSIPAIAAWWYAKDKPWYHHLPPAYRYANFWTEAGDHVIRLPLPYEVGVVFSALPVAFLDAHHQRNPALYRGLIDLAVSQMPPIGIDALGPLWDVARNRNYLNRPIETESMRHELVTERSTPMTAQWAKTLSKAFYAIGWHVSPQVIEYVIEQYTGGIGRNLGSLGQRQIKEPSDVPIIGRQFSPYPEKPSYQLDQFYTRWTQLQQQRASHVLSANDLAAYARHRHAAERLTHIRKHVTQAQETHDRGKIRALYLQEADVLKRAGYP